MSLVRTTPEEHFELRRWIRWMAVLSAIASGAVLVAFRSAGPVWQYFVAFAIFYVGAWISPPVWLLAYVGERLAARFSPALRPAVATRPGAPAGGPAPRRPRISRARPEPSPRSASLGQRASQSTAHRGPAVRITRRRRPR